VETIRSFHVIRGYDQSAALVDHVLLRNLAENSDMNSEIRCRFLSRIVYNVTEEECCNRVLLIFFFFFFL